MTIISFAVALVGFVIFAPVLGCLLAGVDRIVSARLQGRVGPVLLQPYYDVRKLLAKENRSVNGYQEFYIVLSLAFAILSGVFFFAGGNFLLVLFVLTLSSLFFIIAAYSARSPYADAGAQREIIQIASYEPMTILLCVTFFMATNTFNVSEVFNRDLPLVATLPLVFAAFLFILTIKLRKSPFDLSYSHHAHQELVKGITTEMSGRTLALVEITHWYESILFMGWVALFFIWNTMLAIPVVIIAVLLIYFLEVFIDNTFARVKWQAMLFWSWTVTIICCLLNIIYLIVLGYLG
ncbi:MAG: NADH-quinone oxidoreductase subunit H [Coriobacteriales bacterium]|jgi:formate hydrogenlyase subunit 4|nr:NADH-quinone oxidoreductase subunit H [Coriobacteriales bacterium]